MIEGIDVYVEEGEYVDDLDDDEDEEAAVDREME